MRSASLAQPIRLQKPSRIEQLKFQKSKNVSHFSQILSNQQIPKMGGWGGGGGGTRAEPRGGGGGGDGEQSSAGFIYIPIGASKKPNVVKNQTKK